MSDDNSTNLTLALICARGGSKGLTGKNLRLLNGKPLIAHAIETARQCPLIERIFVSTDDANIADVASSFGAEVPFVRPSALSGDSAPEWAVWQHAVNYFEEINLRTDTLVVLPPTGPLRRIKDVSKAINVFSKNSFDIVITVTEARRSPQFNIVKQEKDGSFSLAMPNSKKINRRQDSQDFYDVTTNCYVVRPDYVRNANHLFSGKIGAVCVPFHTGIDIDDELDLELAEFLLDRNSRVYSDEH